MLRLSVWSPSLCVQFPMEKAGPEYKINTQTSVHHTPCLMCCVGYRKPPAPKAALTPAPSPGGDAEASVPKGDIIDCAEHMWGDGDFCVHHRGPQSLTAASISAACSLSSSLEARSCHSRLGCPY